MSRAMYVDEVPGWVSTLVGAIPVDSNLERRAADATRIERAHDGSVDTPFGAFQPMGTCFWQYLRVLRIARAPEVCGADHEGRRQFVWFELDPAAGVRRERTHPGDARNAVPPWVPPEHRPEVPSGILEVVVYADRPPVFVARCNCRY